MNQNTKRLVILNLPYILTGLYTTNLGRAWRMAAGADMTEKMQSLMTVLPDALGRIIPSFHPLDLLVGLCLGAGLRLAVYLKGKNAKKYRHGSEYGSARWGNAKDIEPFMDPKFEENIILTKTERLMLSSRPPDPKNARNKNVLIVGSGGDRVQWTKQGAAAGATLRFLQAPAAVRCKNRLSARGGQPQGLYLGGIEKRNVTQRKANKERR